MSVFNGTRVYVSALFFCTKAATHCQARTLNGGHNGQPDACPDSTFCGQGLSQTIGQRGSTLFLLTCFLSGLVCLGF